MADGGTHDIEVPDRDGYAIATLGSGATVEYLGDSNVTFGSAGTGTFNSFVRVQSDPVEAGYNTDGTLQFDTKSGTWTHSIKVSEIPVVYVGGKPYWELFADINDGNSTPKIQLADLEVWFTANAGLTGYPFPATGTNAATLVYDFSGSIRINDVNQGSGRGDIRYRIPLESIAIPGNCGHGSASCATYFVLYSKWGETPTGTYSSDGGFEEWKVKEYPTLQIVKNTVGGDDTFNFTVTGTPTAPPVPNPSITTSGGTGSTPIYAVEPGTYTITEGAVPAGWTFSGATCSVNGGTATAYTPGANLVLGDTTDVVCTFTNTKQAKIIFDKVTVPAGDAQLFTFDPSWSTTDFQLADATTPHDSGFLVPGTYSVAETVPSGWDLTSATCSDGSPVTAIALGPGETVTCTFTNTKRGKIIVRKITTGSAGGPFGFTTTGGHGLAASFNLTTVTAGVPVGNTYLIGAAGIGGTYTVTESSLATGFVLTDLGCSVNGGAATPGNLGTRTVTITNLQPGAVVTCTFVNSGALTTRTQGFWSTHMWLVDLVWNPSGGTIDTYSHDGMTVAERTLCGRLLAVDDVMGGFWSNIARTSTGARRSPLDQARMRLLQQLLAATLNNQLFGSAPTRMTIDAAKAAYCGTDITAINAAQAAMASFNESGDSGLFTPGASADSKAGRAAADYAFWDILP